MGLKPPRLKTAYLRNHVRGQVAIEGDFVWHGDPELVLALRPLPKQLGLATVAMQLVSGLVRLQVGLGCLVEPCGLRVARRALQGFGAALLMSCKVWLLAGMMVLREWACTASHCCLWPSSSPCLALRQRGLAQ